MSANETSLSSKSQLVNVNHYRSKYGHQHRASARTEQQAINFYLFQYQVFDIIKYGKRMCYHGLTCMLNYTKMKNRNILMFGSCVKGFYVFFMICSPLALSHQRIKHVFLIKTNTQNVLIHIFFKTCIKRAFTFFFLFL